MGYSKDVYVGAYIEAKNELIEKDVFENFCCGINYKLSDCFCRLCGKELLLQKIGKEEIYKINQWDILDSIEETLSIIDDQFMDSKDKIIDLYVSNFKDNTGLEIEDSGFFEITDEIKLNLQKEFLLKFQEEISVLKKAYGEENVSVKFGVIIYYS